MHLKKDKVSQYFCETMIKVLSKEASVRPTLEKKICVDRQCKTVLDKSSVLYNQLSKSTYALYPKYAKKDHYPINLRITPKQ